MVTVMPEESNGDTLPGEPSSAPSPPDAAGGLRWAPAAATDDALAALVARIEAHDDPPYRTTPEELAETLARSDGPRDCVVMAGVDEDGIMRAFATVRLRTVAGTARAVCGGGVDPQWRHRGVGGTVIDWQVRAAEDLAREYDQPSGFAVVHVEDATPDLELLLEGRGFSPTRWYSEMRRDLAVPVPESDLERGLTVEQWSEDLDEAVRRAHNDIAVDHWAAEEHSSETWTLGRSNFVPSWSFVVLDRTSDRAQVVGYLISGRYEQDWEAQGWTEGYTELLGVRREWRGRGVATSMLTAAMRAYAVDGMAYAGISVERTSRGEVGGLFSHLGYEPTRESVVYTRPLNV